MAGRTSAVAAATLAALGTGVGAVLALTPAAAAAPATGGDGVVHPEWGHVQGQDGVLRRGCHTYSYSYAITPPDGDWAIEIFIRGPGPKHGRANLANGAFLDGYDPETGTGHYTLCKPSTRYGQFSIRTRLSVQDGPDSYTEGWLPVAHYRLHAPGRQH